MKLTGSEWEEWNINQARPLTSEALVEVLYYVNNPDLPDAEATAEDFLAPLSDVSGVADTVDREVVAYATLEKNYWLLDGSRKSIPGTAPYEYSGYISGQLCDENGCFSTPLAIDIQFGSVIKEIPGLIITWGISIGEYPVSFTIKTYKLTEQVQLMEFQNNTEIVSGIESPLKNFDRVRIEIAKWCRGNRYARIGKVQTGIKTRFSKKNLLQFSASQEVDPLSASLPKYSVAFEVRDDGSGINIFDPYSSNSLSPYILERQEIRTRYGFRLGETEKWIDGGVYFLSDWNISPNGQAASFQARDLLGFMNDTYNKGVYNPEGIDLYTLAEDVLHEANLPNLKNQAVRWKIDVSLKNIKTVSPLPVCTYAECLQLIANAACAVIYFDRNGTLHIAPRPSYPANAEADFEINENNSYEKANMSILKPVGQIDVSAYSWTIEPEPKELYNASLSLRSGQNEFLIEYSDAAVLGANPVTLSSGFMLDRDKSAFYTRGCRLVIHNPSARDAVCSVRISGKLLKSLETIITVNNGSSGETVTLKNILISDTDRAEAIGYWMKQQYQNRKHLSLAWRLDPAVDVLDSVLVKSGSSVQTAQLYASSFSFSGAFQGKGEGMVCG